MPDTAPRPNFLVVLTDDQGPWAMPHITAELVMPTIANLVDTGSTFDNFYCASPVCSPARASLLTGRMPSAHGVHDWLVGERHPDATEDNFLGGLFNLPETLHHNGYTCAMSGKWHIGTSRWPAPGFDYWYAHRLGGGPYYNAPVWDRDGHKVEEPRYFTDAVTDEAERFLDLQAQQHHATDAAAGQAQPFYLQVNFTAPHDPWINNHPQELYDLYDGCTFDSIDRPRPHPWTKVYNDFDKAFADPLPYLTGYAAALSGVDRSVGRLLDKLDEHGFADNTVVVFMSDNGFSCGQHGIWGKGNGTWPLNFFENSVRVPFAVRLPGQKTARRITDHVSATSFFPTVCELAGITPPDDPLRAGESIAGLIDGSRPGDGSDSVVVYDEYGGGRMIRDNRFKFIDRSGGQPRELYDLIDDPDEQINLVDDPGYQRTVAALADGLNDWFTRHETACDRAFDRAVMGRGQIHPPRKALPDDKTYVTDAVCHDGTRA
ncbi:sulfatase-like hydrolase/transferase [Corynebacterium mendelii]|uniref:Sulfatase-like hydrolase/transferase n=1 Tax=Corynebacterium mendelii TaxID=2765362 RepID=A0A939E1T7_9CORY|nr:sulfatase-like hydrolase/transferase [Corynebacterium mendelii]MBN9644936.1 sulfatase-like hydrolase/transferase [Corynebacterium mendelii]